MHPVFLTKTIANQYETPHRFYLWPLLPDNSVVVTEHIFYRFTQIPELKNYLTDTNDQSIYLDLSQNPEVLDAPQAIAIFDQLNKISDNKLNIFFLYL